MSRASNAVAVIITARGSESWPQDDEELATLVDRYDRTGEIYYVFVRDFGDREHLVQFDEDGWVLRHPLRCRPHLFTCEVNEAIGTVCAPPAAGYGVYRAHLSDTGELVIGDRVGDVE